jgi:hypothetical protein
MKLFLAKLGIIFAMTAVALFGHAEVWGFDWKYYRMNERGTYFYEAESMTRLSKEIVRVCVQPIYTEKGISHWVSEDGKYGKNNKTWSGRGDLNSRLLGPEPSARPGCATPRTKSKMM